MQSWGKMTEFYGLPGAGNFTHAQIGTVDSEIAGVGQRGAYFP